MMWKNSQKSQIKIYKQTEVKQVSKEGKSDYIY